MSGWRTGPRSCYVPNRQSARHGREARADEIDTRAVELRARCLVGCRWDTPHDRATQPSRFRQRAYKPGTRTIPGSAHGDTSRTGCPSRSRPAAPPRLSLVRRRTRGPTTRTQRQRTGTLPPARRTSMTTRTRAGSDQPDSRSTPSRLRRTSTIRPDPRTTIHHASRDARSSHRHGRRLETGVYEMAMLDVVTRISPDMSGVGRRLAAPITGEVGYPGRPKTTPCRLRDNSQSAASSAPA